MFSLRSKNMLIFLLNLISNNLIFNNMKTKQLFLSCILGLSLQIANAQATVANNTITAAHYLGSANNFDILFRRNAVSAGLLATNRTVFGVNALAMPNSVSIGVNAGRFSSGSGSNTYIGNGAGQGLSNTTLNSGVGNTFIGSQSGGTNNTGGFNTLVGANTGANNVGGYGNVYVGNSAGAENTSGYGNVFIGTSAGEVTNGSRNIFIGYSIGEDIQTSNDKLMISNKPTTSPLIWGDFALDQVKLNGKVGIGAVTTFPSNLLYSTYKLFVTGGVLTDEVRIVSSGGTGTWADYVFEKEYVLKPLSEVEQFITKHKHLPNVPSAKEIAENGIALGEMAKIQQEKIEELMLYIIAQNKRIEALEARIGK